jgi:hypothetical protein
MAKQTRIGLVQVDADEPARSPAAEALAVAINNHTAIKRALDDNVVNARNTEDAYWTVNHAVDAGKVALEEAKVADAESIATGKPATTSKAARLALQDLEDQLDATRRAKTMLTDQHADLSSRLSISSSRVNDAVAAVVRSDPATCELIDQLRPAQIKLHEMREVMAVLMPHFPPPSNNAAWEGSAWPTHVRFWDSVNWEEKLPPSATAARVAQWITALANDADAVLKLS